MTNADDLKHDGKQAMDAASDKATSAIETGRESAASGLDKVASQVHGAADQASANLNDSGHKLGDSIESAADFVHDRTDMGSAKLNEGAHNLGHSMESTADYLHEHKARDIVRDASKYARHHPGKTILGAMVMAFLLGRVMKK